MGVKCTKFSFVSLASCSHCGKDLDSIDYVVVYDKCWGKTCPDCGKVRKIRWFKTFEEKSRSLTCLRCKKKTYYLVDKICSKCFLERERKRGCACFFDSDRDGKGNWEHIDYYCKLCEDTHHRGAICKECFKKETKYGENKRLFFKTVLPSLGLV